MANRTAPPWSVTCRRFWPIYLRRGRRLHGWWYDDNGLSSGWLAWRILYLLVTDKEGPAFWHFEWGNRGGGNLSNWNEDRHGEQPYRRFGISADQFDMAEAYVFRFGVFSGDVYFW